MIAETTLHRGLWRDFKGSARTAQALLLAIAEHQRYLAWLGSQPLQ